MNHRTLANIRKPKVEGEAEVRPEAAAVLDKELLFGDFKVTRVTPVANDFLVSVRFAPDMLGTKSVCSTEIALLIGNFLVSGMEASREAFLAKYGLTDKVFNPSRHHWAMVAELEHPETGERRYVMIENDQRGAVIVFEQTVETLSEKNHDLYQKGRFYDWHIGSKMLRAAKPAGDEALFSKIFADANRANKTVRVSEQTSFRAFVDTIIRKDLTHLMFAPVLLLDDDLSAELSLGKTPVLTHTEADDVPTGLEARPSRGEFPIQDNHLGRVCSHAIRAYFGVLGLERPNVEDLYHWDADMDVLSLGFWADYLKERMMVWHPRQMCAGCGTLISLACDFHNWIIIGSAVLSYKLVCWLA